MNYPILGKGFSNTLVVECCFGGIPRNSCGLEVRPRREERHSRFIAFQQQQGKPEFLGWCDTPRVQPLAEAPLR